MADNDGGMSAQTADGAPYSTIGSVPVLPVSSQMPTPAEQLAAAAHHSAASIEHNDVILPDPIPDIAFGAAAGGTLHGPLGALLDAFAESAISVAETMTNTPYMEVTTEPEDAGVHWSDNQSFHVDSTPADNAEGGVPDLSFHSSTPADNAGVCAPDLDFHSGPVGVDNAPNFTDSSGTAVHVDFHSPEFGAPGG